MPWAFLMGAKAHMLYLPSKRSTKAYKQKMPRNIPGIGMDCCWFKGLMKKVRTFQVQLSAFTLGWQCINRFNESESIGAIRVPFWRHLECFESRILLHPVFLITFSYGHICFCIFVAEGFVPPFEWKCIWSKIFLALIWKFRIWICGFYKIEPFQSVVITLAMFEFSVGKCLHFTHGQNNHITWLWRSKYFRTHVCHGGQGKIFNLSYLLCCW